MAIAAMGERYGERLVGQLAQAGGMIENGLKAVTTMKELQSLGQNLSQISPESPDYQQQLMQLGAAHPFAMQDPRGQALVNMGNQQHLQWRNQQFAMQQADRQAERAEAHDKASYTRQGKRDASLHDFRMKEIDQRWGGGGEGGFDFSGGLPTKPTPVSGFSDDTLGGASAANMGDPSMVQPEPSLFIDATAAEPTRPPAGFSAKGQAMGDPKDKERQDAYWKLGKIVQETYGGRPLSGQEVERLVIAPVNKELAAAKAAAGKKGSTGVLYATEQEAIDALDGTALGGGLFMSPYGGVYKPKQAASGKWYLSSPDEGDVTEREKFEAELKSKKDAQDFAERKSEEAAARADYNSELVEMEKSVRDAKKAFLNATAAKDTAYVEGKEKEFMAAKAVLDTAERHMNAEKKQLEDFKKTKPKFESSSGNRGKRLTAEVKERFKKLANGDLKKAAEMARNEGYIP